MNTNTPLEEEQGSVLNRNVLGMSVGEILAWVFVYLIISWSLTTMFAVLNLLANYFPLGIWHSIIQLLGWGLPLLMILIGLISLVPLSEYFYMRGAGTNPPIARESIRHSRRKPEKRGLGIIVGISGLTFITQVSPSDLLLAAVMQNYGIEIAAFSIIVLLVLLIHFYRGRLAKNVDLGT